MSDGKSTLLFTDLYSPKLSIHNPLEQVVISVLDTLSHATERVAHLTGLSINPFLPVSLKCIMSCYQLAEDDSLKERLLLSKEDFRTMRRINMFTPYSILS